MTWADLIIISIATVLGMVMNRLDQQTTYNCPLYCAVDHLHYCGERHYVILDSQSRSFLECLERD